MHLHCNGAIPTLLGEYIQSNMFYYQQTYSGTHNPRFWRGFVKLPTMFTIWIIKIHLWWLLWWVRALHAIQFFSVKFILAAVEDIPEPSHGRVFREKCRSVYVVKWPLFRAQTTHLRCAGLIFVRGKLNPANGSGLNFQKYTTLYSSYESWEWLMFLCLSGVTMPLHF